MSMAHGLEVRVPLIDHVLVEYALKLPATIKRGNGRGKYLLIKAMNGMVPAEIVGNKKSGFNLPFARWMTDELREMVESGLSRLEQSGVFPAGFVSTQWREFLRGRQHWIRLWQLFTLSHHVV